MKKLLYIGHSYHNKTKSSQFIQDILKKDYEITKFDFDPYNDSFDIFNKLKGSKFHNVILWQIRPDMNILKKYISFDKIAYFPMYDGRGNLDDYIWKGYKNCNIINFSKTLHRECIKRGFSSHYIQYFPQPIEFQNYGDKNSIFLWQRINKINANIIEKLCDTDKIKKLYLHNATDPNHIFINPPESLANKTEITTWFDTKKDLMNHIQKSAIYIAPRHEEGIGMSFLEAMAMGRCVIAPNNPTMNEYITNGVNGYLYNLNNPEKINIENIEQIQKNTLEYIQNGYQSWENNKLKILKWINTSAKPNKFKMWKYYNDKKVFQNIFSIKNKYKNNQKRKIIRFLGIKISIKTQKGK